MEKGSSKGIPGSPTRMELLEAQFKRLEERFDEYAALPTAEMIAAAAAPPPRKGSARPASASATMGGKPKVKLDTFKVSKRIMQEKQYINQYRQPKGVDATLRWRTPPDVGGELAPSPRVDMSLTRLGWGDHARLVLFGGYEEFGFASSEVYLFDPLRM